MAWILFAWTCALAAPIELPAGEDPALWVNPLALAGIAPDALEPGVAVRFTPSGAGWSLWVRDVSGTEHRVTVAAPATRADREALAALAASLVHPVAVPTVELPPLPPVVRVPQPRPVVVPEPAVVVVAPPEPEVVVVEPEVVAVVEPEVVAVAPDVVEPEVVAVAPDGVGLPEEVPAVRVPGTTRWWAGAGPILRMRPAVRSMLAGGVWAGVVRGAWRLGAGIEGTAPAVLRAVDPETRMTVADLRATGAWAPGWWELGPVAGISFRTFTEGSTPVLIPEVGGMLARRIPVGAVSVRIALVVERDVVPLRLATLGFNPEDTALEPLSAGLGVSVWTRDPPR